MGRRGSRGGRKHRGAGGQGSRVQVIEERGDDMTPKGEAARKAIAAWSGFDGANRSARRSMIYFPQLDTQRELDSYSRTELLRKGRWMMRNMGFPRRVVYGLADLCGYLRPQWQSGDKDWNRRVERLWADRSGVIDAAGELEMEELQLHLDRSAFQDGDVLPVIVKGSTGGAMIALYEATQLATPKGQQQNKRWIDGVRINKFGRKVAFGIRNFGNDTVATIAADDALYYAHVDAARRVRPPSILAHAINHLLDTADILADVKLAVKVAAQFGIYRKAGGQNFTPAQALGFNLRNERIDPGGTEKADGSATEIDARIRELKVEDLYKSLGGVAALAAGEELGTVQDSRPHPNQLELLKWLVRDISWGAGTSPEFLWDLTQIGGAGVRLMNADLERWLLCRVLRKRRFMRKFCAVWTVHEMSAGRLDEPSTGQFWKTSHIPQKSLTADKGREGKLNIELVKAGMMSLRKWFGQEGEDWEEELEQIAIEKERRGALGLDLEDVLAAPAGENPDESAEAADEE